MGFAGGSVVKNSSAKAGDIVWSFGYQDPLEEELATNFSILAWKSHGQRSLLCCGPRGHKTVGHNLVTTA